MHPGCELGNFEKSPSKSFQRFDGSRWTWCFQSFLYFHFALILFDFGPLSPSALQEVHSPFRLTPSAQEKKNKRRSSCKSSVRNIRMNLSIKRSDWETTAWIWKWNSTFGACQPKPHARKRHAHTQRLFFFLCFLFFLCNRQYCHPGGLTASKKGWMSSQFVYLAVGFMFLYVSLFRPRMIMIIFVLIYHI